MKKKFLLPVTTVRGKCVGFYIIEDTMGCWLGYRSREGSTSEHRINESIYDDLDAMNAESMRRIDTKQPTKKGKQK